jgi:thiamine pyrophosphate-dependent acetolactate synthase large subunit-like protein
MLPIDVQTLPVPEHARAPAPATPVPAPPAPRPDAVTAAVRLLAPAQRPLILAGRGAVLAGAAGELEALGERIGALLATSAVAKGLFAGLPFDLGISGAFATPLAAELLPQADVVLAVGATLNHWTTRHGELVAPGATVIQVDVEADAIGASRPATVAIVGDARLTAGALLATLGNAGGGDRGWRSPELARRIATGRWRDEPYEEAGGEQYIDPRTLSIALADLLPEDVCVTVDSGHFMGYPSFFLDVPDARSWIFVNAFQAVGLGLASAIGAAVARPERITVAALGDGGTLLALQEIETAVRLGLRLLVVVYDDAAYGAEVHHFRTLGEEVGLAQFPPTDLAAIARACGAAGVTVRSVADLAAVADWVDGGAGPLLVDAKVDPGVCADWLHEAFRTG